METGLRRVLGSTRCIAAAATPRSDHRGNRCPEEKTVNTMKTIKALDLPDVFLLVQILIFGVTIPTVDTYSDLILSWNLFASGHHLWAVATFLPVLVCFAFTSVAFYQIPFSSPYHRYIGLPVLVLQVDNV